MNNKTKTQSCINESWAQIRYQKALKQINKVINFNTQLKNQANDYQLMINELHIKLQMNNDELNKITRKMNELQNQSTKTNNQKCQLFLQNEKLKNENIRLKDQIMENNQEKYKKQNKEGFAGWKSSSGQETSVALSLEKIINSNHETTRQPIKPLSFFQIINSNFDEDKTVNSENTIIPMNTLQLNKKLAIATQYIQQLNDQCADLKSKLIKAETANQILTVRYPQNLLQSNQLPTKRNQTFLPLQKKNSMQVLKHYHKLEQQNKKISKKYKHCRHQSTTLIQINHKLEQQNKKMHQQISCYEQLIKKQQNIISDLHINFNEEIITMTNQFKYKLQQYKENYLDQKHEQYTKISSNLKKENQILKKKSHLCSIQLTKCFEILEKYKIKLTQCEKDYHDLVNQKQELLQKLISYEPVNSNQPSKSKIESTKNRIETELKKSYGQTIYINYS